VTFRRLLSHVFGRQTTEEKELDARFVASIEAQLNGARELNEAAATLARCRSRIHKRTQALEERIARDSIATPPEQ